MSDSDRNKESSIVSVCVMIVIAAIVNIAVYVLAPMISIQFAGLTIGLTAILSVLGLVYCVYCVEAQAKHEMETVTSRIRGPDTTPGGHNSYTCPECGGMGYYEIHESNISDHIICRYCGKAFSIRNPRN